eukprot:2273274-Rhodomonas_salina.3
MQVASYYTLLRASYAMSGADAAYAATRREGANSEQSRICLRACYAMSGTETAHRACYAIFRTEIAYGVWALYGTEIAYGTCYAMS